MTHFENTHISPRKPTTSLTPYSWKASHAHVLIRDDLRRTLVIHNGILPSSFLLHDPSTPCSSSSSSSTIAGYFADRALQADSVVQPMTAVESLQRLIKKERIQEEILREGQTQKRILEEEVRRELEIERLMLMRRVHPERFCDPSVGSFMPEMRIRDENERDLVSCLPIVGIWCCARDEEKKRRRRRRKETKRKKEGEDHKERRKEKIRGSGSAGACSQMRINGSTLPDMDRISGSTLPDADQRRVCSYIQINRSTLPDTADQKGVRSQMKKKGVRFYWYV